MEFSKICQNKDCNEQYLVKRKDRIETSKYCSAKCRMHCLGLAGGSKARKWMLGRSPVNKGKKGLQIGWSKGLKWSDMEISDKMKLAAKNLGLEGAKYQKMMKGKNFEERFGKFKSDELRKNLSLNNSGSNHPNFGKHRTEQTKKKLRIFRVNTILKNGSWSSIGKHEKELLNLQEQKDNCKILRQWNTGIGYIVDGYCPETNTVYEVYEKAHDKKIFEDLNRETEICNHLSCDFIILWDRQCS